MVASVLLFVGCSSDTESASGQTQTQTQESTTAPEPAPADLTPQPEPEETVVPEPTEDTNSLEEDVFLQTIRGLFPGTPDSDLLALGYEACAALDAGGTLIDMAWDYAVSDSSDPESFGAVIGASAGALCPEHLESVLKQADELSSL